MLVKFKNDSKEFEAKVDVLKHFIDVGVASKVAAYCVDNYMDLYTDHQNLKQEKEDLLLVISDLKQVFLDEESVKQRITNILKRY